MTEPATQPAVVATTTSLASSSSSQQQLTLTSSTNSMFMTMPIESISSLRSLDGLSQSSLDGAATTTQPPEQQVVQQQPNNKLTEKDNAAAFGLSLLRRQSSSGWKSLSATDKILEGDGPSSDRQLFGITSLSQLNSDYSGGFGAVSSTTDKRWGARLSRQSSLATQQTEDGASTASSCSDGCSPGIKVLQQPSPPTTSSSSEKKSSSSSSKKKPLSMEDMIRKQFHLELPPTPTTKTAAPSRASTTTKPAGSSTTTTSPPAALTTTTTTNPNKKSASRALFPSTSNSNNNNNNDNTMMLRSSGSSTSTSEYKPTPSSSSLSDASASGSAKRKRPSATSKKKASSSKKIKTTTTVTHPSDTDYDYVDPRPIVRDLTKPSPVKKKPVKTTTTSTSASTTTASDHEWVSEDAILENDVLCCKGGKSNHWPGNKRYRRLIAERRPSYHSSTISKSTKTSMSNALVDHVHGYGGRFLKGRKNQAGFFIMSKKEARRKVAQNLRESKEFKWLK